MPQSLGQRLDTTDGISVNQDHRELTWMARAVSQVEIRRDRVNDVATAVQGGRYRVPAQVLAACLMLEMLH
ncbi:MAG TPA: flagellar biosynthesis anti-sigma factor FlgM [Acidobacteriaceae bacterium]|nr:flagellar biosynthesis anti-sigma factor FlgM [Acidobacteriaceae bacterium]